MQVFSFNGKGDVTPADMFDAVSILCTNGATVSASGVAAIPGNDKIIENRLVRTCKKSSGSRYLRLTIVAHIDNGVIT